VYLRACACCTAGYFARLGHVLVDRPLELLTIPQCDRDLLLNARGEGVFSVYGGLVEGLLAGDDGDDDDVDSDDDSDDADRAAAKDNKRETRALFMAINLLAKERPELYVSKKARAVVEKFRSTFISPLTALHPSEWAFLGIAVEVRAHPVCTHFITGHIPRVDSAR
jgi:hypothetical protein